MPQDGSDVLSSVKSIGEYFRVDKSKSSLCFLLTDRQQLNGFKEIVAEPVVELPFYAFDFILALLGKRNRLYRRTSYRRKYSMSARTYITRSGRSEKT